MIRAAEKGKQLAALIELKARFDEKTARLYEDLGMLTCDPDIGADLSQLFKLPHRVRAPGWRRKNGGGKKKRVSGA